MADLIAAAIRDTFISPNEADRNSEPANVVDGLFAIARGLNAIADALTDEDGANITDATYSLARALRDLGNADAGTQMGGLEAHGKAMLESADKIAGAIEGLASQ